MERGLRFGDVLHDIVDNSESMVFREEELDVVIATRHNREPLVEAIEKLVVSFDIHDPCGLVERRLQYNFSRKSKATFLFSIFEASRGMVSTMELAYTNDVKNLFSHEGLKIWIIGIRKGLENSVGGTTTVRFQLRIHIWSAVAVDVHPFAGIIFRQAFRCNSINIFQQPLTIINIHFSFLSNFLRRTRSFNPKLQSH